MNAINASPRAAREVNRRWLLLQGLRKFLEQGYSPKRAPKLVGADRITLWRWSQAFERDGFAGLIPQRHKCGRKPKVKEAA